jgi:hypothetical protein
MVKAIEPMNILPYNIDDETSWYDPKRFAHMAANVFLFMYIRPRIKAKE